MAGGAALALLLIVARTTNLDSLLLVSKAIFNIFSGVRQMLLGAGLLAIGLAQALGLFALSFVTMVSVLAVATGLVRLLVRILPGFRGVWLGFARLLGALIGVLGVAPAAQKPAGRPHAPPAKSLSHDLQSRSASTQRSWPELRN